MAGATSSRPRPSVCVVGAGIGGLVGAIELAARGWDVTVLDAAASVGGKMRRERCGERWVDAGPTVLTLRTVLDDVFSRAGTQLAQHLTLEPMHTLARHVWPDGSQLDLFDDPHASARAIAAFADDAEAQRFLQFLAHARQIWQTVEGPFVHAQRPTPAGILATHGLAALPMLLRIDSRRTMWQALGHYFRDPRLQQLFGRYATYTGCSPFQAPATLNLVAWVETQGVWRVQGGMHKVALALQAVLQGLGGRVVLDTPVAQVRVTHGRASGVTLASGEQVPADVVLFAGDAAALAGGLLGDAARGAVKPVAPRERSLSAVTWCLEAETAGVNLVHHNVFFGGPSHAEFSALFGRQQLPAAPTVYVCAQDRDDGATAAGPERLLVLVNAPATADSAPLAAEELVACQDRTFKYLQQLGLRVTPTAVPVQTSPVEFAARFPGTGGALYGAATHRWTATLDRPAARTAIPGLYLAGGSAHPGAGVPMAALSGRLAAEAIAADQPSTHRSLPAATPGGTSTRSATAAATR